MTILYRNFKLGLNSNETELPAMLERKLRLRPGSIRKLDIVKRSLDSRGGRRPRFVYSMALALDQRQESRLLGRKHPLVERYPIRESVLVPRLAAGDDARPRPVIIGAGPAGLFAAWRLAAAGVAPVIVERGPEITDRAKRWHAFMRGGAFDPECNLLFGEGGAGAFSDGKLYTRVNDPRAREVLEVLADHGAPREILLDARPHVGSNLLPSIIRKLRRHLVELGVEVRFDTCMEDLRLGAPGGLPLPGDGERGERQRHVTGVQLTGGRVLDTDSVFLGTGHSARDTYRRLFELGVAMEPKPFQMGVRVEHSQAFIDQLQYGAAAGHPRLPPAEYSLVVRREDGDVFSFCMCPGGEILPATERPDVICVNGASKHQRKGPFASSGFVVTVTPEAFPGDALAGLRLQEQVERGAVTAAGRPFAVPALRLDDFVAGQLSSSLPDCSYPFGCVAVPFEGWMPQQVLAALRSGLTNLGERLPGFVTDGAIVVGPESRSSSPLRIVRDSVTLQSRNVDGLYPMGEGAGYAGGILSAAIDGMRCAEAWLAVRTGASVDGDGRE